MHKVFGYNKNEIKDLICAFIGRGDTAFKSYLDQIIPLAEARIINMHDWSYLHKIGLKLNLLEGIAEYELSALIDQYDQSQYMNTDDIRIIYNDSNKLLTKTESETIRQLDEEFGEPTHWAPLNQMSILLYPMPNENSVIYIDGKIIPPLLTESTQYPTIPFKFQESFINYLIALALERDNDDRAQIKKSEAITLIQVDIRKDAEIQQASITPRMKHWKEQK